MFEQQNASLIVEDKRAGGYREAALPETHDSPAQRARQIAPDVTEEFREHGRSIARGVGRLSFTPRFSAVIRPVGEGMETV